MSVTRAVVLEDNGEEASAELHRDVQNWNEQQIGPRNTRLLTFSIRDENGRLIAGLDGELHWNAFYLGTLWVDQSERRRGYGTALMDRTAAVVKEHGCEVIFLSTFTFQAPRFYEKRGYVPFGELPYGGKDFKRVWFAKRL